MLCHYLTTFRELRQPLLIVRICSNKITDSDDELKITENFFFIFFFLIRILAEAISVTYAADPLDLSRQRTAPSGQMSAFGDGRGLAGYTLDDVLANNKRPPPPPASASALTAEIRSRTLLDIIRDEEPGAGKGLFGHRDKRSWKSLRDKLRIKRAGSAWVSTVPIPTSDIPVHTKRSLIGKRNQVRFNTVSPQNSGELTQSIHIKESSNSSPGHCRSQISGPSSIRSESTHHDDQSDSAPVRITRQPISRHNSVRVTSEMDDFSDPTEPERDHRVRKISHALSEERTISAREAVAAQEAADAAAVAEAAEEEEDDENEGSTTGSEASQPVRMSLMDLLHETDREMGWEASIYTIGDDDGDDEEFYEDEEEEEDEKGEFSCCVCMVRHRGAVMIQCGHSYCRLCSKELMVCRGNCPACNGFISEILRVF